MTSARSPRTSPARGCGSTYSAASSTLRQEELLEAERAVAEASRSDQETAQRLFELAFRTRVDVLQAELLVSQQRLLVRQQAGRLEQARLAFRTVLGQLDVPVGFRDQSANEVLDVATDISCFTEFCGIRLDEWDPEAPGDELDEKGFADSRGPHHEDVVLDVANELLFLLVDGKVELVEVGADLGCEDRLRFILADYVLVEVGNQVLRLNVKLKSLFKSGPLDTGPRTRDCSLRG